MKKLVLFFLLSLTLTYCSSQDLDGVWKESDSLLSDEGSPMVLYFARNPDKSYKISSYTRFLFSNGRDTVLVCDVTFRKSKKYFILKETQDEIKDWSFLGLQKMYLKYEKHGSTETLSGIVVSNGPFEARSKISFTKIK